MEPRPSSNCSNASSAKAGRAVADTRQPTIQGEPIAPMQSDLYDGTLEARVRQYQRERHLTADGLVSHQTQVAIIADLGAAETPRLARIN